MHSVLATLTVIIALPFFALAQHAHSNSKRHGGLVRRVSTNHTESPALAKRDDVHSGILTWYPTGLGACGITNGVNDFIVAASESTYFPPGQYPADICFKTVTIQWQGKTATATITDACQSCDPNHLDASHGLMQFFTQEDELDDITWWFEGDGPATSSTTSIHTTSSSTSTWSSTPTTTTTKSSTSTTSTHASTTSHSTTSTPATSSTPTSTSSTATPTPTQQGIIESMAQAFLGLAAIAAVGDAGN